jgi:hypothetical protein
MVKVNMTEYIKWMTNEFPEQLPEEFKQFRMKFAARSLKKQKGSQSNILK